MGPKHGTVNGCSHIPVLLTLYKRISYHVRVQCCNLSHMTGVQDTALFIHQGMLKRIRRASVCRQIVKIASLLSSSKSLLLMGATLRVITYEQSGAKQLWLPVRSCIMLRPSVSMLSVTVQLTLKAALKHPPVFPTRQTAHYHDTSFH
jgi:hypothetical protein